MSNSTTIRESSDKNIEPYYNDDFKDKLKNF